MSHYLDFAATSAVRPAEVTQAVTEFLINCGASPGRGGHSLSIESGRIQFRARRAVAKVMGLPGDPGRLAFLFNATHALNTAMFGTVQKGDVIVVSSFDHNAVFRPAFALAETREAEVRVLQGRPDGSVDLEEAARLYDGARLVVLNAASNVLGSRLPVRELTAIAHDAGALVLVDAAQSAGHLKVSHAEEGADLIAFTGHKGLLGPPGTGGLWVREGLEVAPFMTGGTGGNSTLRCMPPDMPDRLEAGTTNSAGLAGLLAGCQFLLEQGIETLHAEEARLKAMLRDGLSSIPSVRVVSPPAPDGVGVVTLVSSMMDPATLANRLNSEFGVMGRHGLHCAPDAHKVLGTHESGALRLSLGWSSTEEDVTQALRAIDTVSKTPSVAV